MLTNRQCNELNQRICEKAMEVSDQAGKDRQEDTITWIHQTDIIMKNINEGILNEFGPEMDEGILADVYEFIDQYELPYRLQKEFGLIGKAPRTVIERVCAVKEDAGYDLYCLRINNNTLVCESRDDLVGILNESRLGERACIGTEYTLGCDGSQITFIGKAKGNNNEIS